MQCIEEEEYVQEVTAYTVGLNEKAIMDYVEYQYKEDTGQLKLELGE